MNMGGRQAQKHGNKHSKDRTKNGNKEQKFKNTMGGKGFGPGNAKPIEGAHGKVIMKGYLDDESARANAQALRELDQHRVKGQTELRTGYRNNYNDNKTYGKPAQSRGTVFSSELAVIEKPEIRIPIEINDICDEVQERVGHNEFSILCKGHWNAKGYLIEKEFAIPRQEVTGSSVDYDSEHIGELKAQGFNTVIHSHPFKSSNFSGSDRDTINSNFGCSILYSEGDFTAGVITIDVSDDAILSIAADKIIVERDVTIPEVDVSNITKRDYSYNNDHGSAIGNPKSLSYHAIEGSMEVDEYNGPSVVEVRSRLSMSDEEVEMSNIDKWNSFKERKRFQIDSMRDGTCCY